jgi:23S rRNA (cytidine1920-2'-O)/16S rRNA (cytidine1409-2'-O)-methyltransferase
MSEFVSRAGQKLDHALTTFGIDVSGWTCADLGSNVGGFVDCLLQRGAKKVYAIETGYGVLDWKLRKDPRVIVMERTNAMHVKLPEKVKLVTIDVAWTKQKNILPAAKQMIEPDGSIISLIKPHYESPPRLLKKGVLPKEKLDGVLETVRADIADAGVKLVNLIESPLKGTGGNVEMLGELRLTEF